MARELTVTEAELLQALAAAGTAPDDARTVQELVDLVGFCPTKVRQTLRAIANSGRLRTHWVERARIDGHVTKVPAYTILPAA